MADAVDLLGSANARVVAGNMTKAAFKNLEMIQGLNHNPDGMLADPFLRRHVKATETYTSDWVHDALQDGVFTGEAWLFLKACRPYGISSEDVRSFLADDTWQFLFFARTKARGLWRVFESFRSSSSSEADKLKCSASELLGLYSLLRYLFDSRLPHHEELIAQRESFAAACKILDLILLAKRGVTSAVETSGPLLVAIQEHLRLHKLAYGTTFIKPKNHWLMDVPPQLLRDKLVLDAFIVERLHLVVKSVAENVLNTSTFEKSVLAGIFNVQFRKASEAMHGCAADLSPLSSLFGRLRRTQGCDLASHMTYLSLQANQGNKLSRKEVEGRR